MQFLHFGITYKFCFTISMLTSYLLYQGLRKQSPLCQCHCQFLQLCLHLSLRWLFQCLLHDPISTQIVMAHLVPSRAVSMCFLCFFLWSPCKCLPAALQLWHEEVLWHWGSVKQQGAWCMLIRSLETRESVGRKFCGEKVNWTRMNLIIY